MFLFSSRNTNSIEQELTEENLTAAIPGRLSTRCISSSGSRRGTTCVYIKARAAPLTVIFTLLFFVLPGFVLPSWGETLPSGTEITIRLDQDIQPADKNSKNSNKFSAPLAFPVFVNSREVVPAGTKVEGVIRGSKKEIFLSPRFLILPDGRQIDFNATVSAINQKRLKADEKEGTIEGKSDTGAAAQQAGEVGAMGGLIGALSTGSMKGMGIGAAIGVGAVLIGRKIAGHGTTYVIPAGTQLTLDLNQPLEVPDDAADAKPPEDQSRDREDSRPTLRRADPETP